MSVLLCVAILLIQPIGAVFSQHQEEIDAETMASISQIRGEVAVYRDVENAIDAGYSPFLDCLLDDVEGGMGQHYVNRELVGDGMVDALRPEALVYEPREDGSLILVALEYLVPLPLWTEDDPPALFGHSFHENVKITQANPEANPAWILHLWIGAHNPNGVFTDYNPTVFCPGDAPADPRCKLQASNKSAQSGEESRPAC
jgi:hypothetical protein